MMFAHVTGTTVDQVGYPPALAYVGGRWYDLRPRDAATLALAGWFPVTETPKPEDTQAGTFDVAYTVDGGTVTQSWEPREWSEQEKDQQAQILDLTERVAAIEAYLFTALPPSEDGVPWEPPVAPGAVTLWQGVRYRNVSGAWLVSDPSEYPIGYVNLDATPTAEWSPGLSVSVGEQYTYQGKTYQVVQAHTTQAGWEPPNLPALWQLVS